MKKVSTLKLNLMRAAMTLALILACATAWAQTKQSVTFIDENGQTQTVNATVLTGNESSLGSDGTTTWYVVNSNINSGGINYRGNVNIILADGCTMTTRNDNGDGIHGYSSSTLTIYGQTLGTGTLAATGGGAGNPTIYSSDGDIIINGGNVTASATSASANCINAGSVTINGGTVTATATGSSSQGIFGGTVTINGGNVTASGTSTGISANWGSGTITLGWTNANDQIQASSYSGTVKIADGKALKNGGTVYYGTLTAAQKSAIANVTLQPATQAEFIAAALPQTGTNEYTIYDSVGWNAFCLALDDNDTWNHFSGKTVKLGANISITQSAGSAGHEFMGTFDGDGKTLTVDITETTTQGTAPFREIKGATIQNLVVTGSVEGTIHAAGLVGFARGDASILNTITNCKVATNVTVTTPGGNNNNNYHCGGVVGHAFHCTLNMSNTVYCGNITNSGNYVGGLQGWSDGNTIIFSHCLFVGSYSGTASFHPVAVRNNNSATTADVSHVYYTATPTLTSSNFIAADGTKATGRTTAPDNLGSHEATYSFMDMTVYVNGLYYNGLYYVAPTLNTDNSGAYLISSVDDWTNFCDMLYDNATWNRFSGKTVKLGANITVTQMAGGSNHAFTGTFDGNHKTLTLNYGTVQAPIDAEFVAPFPEVRGGAEFINLNIDGHIYAAYTGSSDPGVGGLIGHLFGGITIEGCTSTVEINSTKDRVGGFVGLCEDAVTFTNCKSSAVVTCTGSGSGFVGWSRDSNYTIAFYGCLFNGKVLKKNGVGSGNGGFVGWKGYHKTVEITNCLVDPAAVAEGETMADDNSATFCRYSADTSLDNQATSITNCYYTETFGNAQGTQAYSISKGQYVTTLEINGTATQSYTVSGLSFYSTGIKYGDVLYAAENDVVSLILGCTPPAGFTCTGYTATSGNLNGTTLTMPHENVTINVTLEALPAVSYLDASGNTQQCTAYTLLDGTETSLGTADQETWYVADGTINFNQTINVNGVVHLILKDNAVMNVGTEQNPISDSGISAEGPSISIYGQSTGSDIGMLSVYATYCGIYDYDYSGNNNNPNYDYAVTINGGNIFVSASSYGIQSNKVTINGGQVWATAGISGIASYPNAITLGWTSPYDLIYADAYQGDVIVKSGKAFINNDNPSNNVVTGTVSDYSLINGMFLQPAVAVTLNDGITAGSGIISSGENLYAQAAVPVTVDASSVIAPPGYAVSGITVTPTVTVTNNGNGIYSFTTPAADVTVNATIELQPVSVTYLDENGVQHTVDALPLLGGGATTLAAGWYVVNSNISYTGTVTLVGSGDVKLILADDHTMNVGTSENRIEYGIKTYNNDQTLTIYGQSTGNHMGILSIYTSHYCIYPLALTINGGHVIANADGNYATALRTTYQTITINGGTVEATATGTGAYAIHSGDNFTYAGGTLITNAASENAIKAYHGRYTFTWRNPNDSITIGSTGLYAPDDTYTATFTKAFTDGTNIYSGTLRGSQLNALAGKTLHPVTAYKTIAAHSTTEQPVSGWYLIASPVGDVSATAVNNLANTNDNDGFDLYRFNQAADAEWENWKSQECEGNHYHFDLESGRGYLYANAANVNLIFTGTPYSGEGTFNLERSDSNDIDENMRGWNLMGNPFAETANVDRSFYVMNDGGSEIIAAERTYAEPMEGIFVYAQEEGSSVTFIPVASSQGRAQKPEPEQVVLNLSRNGGSVIDRAIVRMGEGRTLPKFQIRENSTKLYIPQDGKEYAIAFSDGQGEMPVNFKAKENGTYTITVNPQGVEMSYLHLIDNMTGADIDLIPSLRAERSNPEPPVSYTFTAKTTDYESRFKLVFIANDASTGSASDATFAFVSNGNLIVNGEGTLQVIDLMGRVIRTVGLSQCGSRTSTAGMTPCVYVLRLINGDNVRTQKIVIP